MARKLSLRELRDSSMKSHIGRLMGSLHYPLSPEGERVLAAAKVGLQLIRERKTPEKKTKRKVTDSRVVEENFPDSIREMLKLHRNELSKLHPTQPLRPDQA